MKYAKADFMKTLVAGQVAVNHGDKFLQERHDFLLPVLGLDDNDGGVGLSFGQGAPKGCKFSCIPIRDDPAVHEIPEIDVRRISSVPHPGFVDH